MPDILDLPASDEEFLIKLSSSSLLDDDYFSALMAASLDESNGDYRRAYRIAKSIYRDSQPGRSNFAKADDCGHDPDGDFSKGNTCAGEGKSSVNLLEKSSYVLEKLDDIRSRGDEGVLRRTADRIREAIKQYDQSDEDSAANLKDQLDNFISNRDYIKNLAGRNYDKSLDTVEQGLETGVNPRRKELEEYEEELPFYSDKDLSDESDKQDEAKDKEKAEIIFREMKERARDRNQKLRDYLNERTRDRIKENLEKAEKYESVILKSIHTSGRSTMIVHKSTREPGRWQLSFIDGFDGKPNGHATFDTKEEAITSASGGRVGKEPPHGDSSYKVREGARKSEGKIQTDRFRKIKEWEDGSDHISSSSKSVSALELGQIIADQYGNRKKHFTAQAMADEWVTSKSFKLVKSVPIWALRVYADVHSKSHSTGPIFVDRKKESEHDRFGPFLNMPTCIILDGKHRAKDALEAGKTTLDAFIGDDIYEELMDWIKKYEISRQLFVESLNKFYKLKDQDEIKLEKVLTDLFVAGMECGLTSDQLTDLVEKRYKDKFFDVDSGEFINSNPVKSRFAKAGDVEDCGHEVAKTRKAGKFAPGNTCAGEGGEGETEESGDSEPIEEGFTVSNKSLPESMRGLLTDEELTHNIRSEKTLSDMIRLYERALQETKEGDLPTIKEIMTIAKVGESTKGQYEWTGNMMKSVLGERNANIWMALNSILSTRAEYREHTIGSMRLMKMWIDAGEPRDKESIDTLIDEFARLKRVNDQGKEVQFYTGLIDEETGKTDWPGKWDGIQRILQNPDKEDFRADITKGEKISKTQEFYDSWTKPGSFTYDKWISRLTKPEKLGEEGLKLLVDSVADQSTGKRMTKEGKKTFDRITYLQEKLVSRPSVYLAFKAASTKAAEFLTENTGEEWQTRDIQEATWSAVIAISTLKSYGMSHEEIPKALTHEMVNQSWDIKSLISEGGLGRELRQFGIPERTLESIHSWEKFSSRKEPPKKGRIDEGDTGTIEDIIKRIPSSPPRTKKGKRVIIYDEETGQAKEVKRYSVDGNIYRFAYTPEQQAANREKLKKHLADKKQAGHAKAGSAEDCGHEEAGRSKAGKFAPDNTCHTGTGVEKTGPQVKNKNNPIKSVIDLLSNVAEDLTGGPVKQSGAKIKAKPVRGEMVEAKRVGTGKEAKIVMSDGSQVPEHIKTSMIPPAWTDVRVAVDPDAEVLVTGRDEKGRSKMVTSKSYDARSAAIKFSRVTDIIMQHEKISREIQKARKDPATKEEADVSWLMQVQATRPGSDRDTKAKHKAYGATTLQGRHIVQTPSGVWLRFIGKEGVSHSHMIKDPELAQMLLERKQNLDDQHAKLFNTDDAKVRDFVAQRDGGKFSPKDFRTSAATRLALKLVTSKPKPSKNAAEHKKRVKEVAEKVSKLLGNRPAEALKSYIHPSVFSQWMPANE